MEAVVNGLLGGALKRDETSPQRIGAARERERRVEELEAEHLVLANFLNDRVRHNGGGEFHLLRGQLLTILAHSPLGFGAAPQISRERHRPAFTVRVDGWVCHLRERLLQVLEEGWVVLAEDRQHPVVT